MKWIATSGGRTWTVGDGMAGELVRNTITKAAGDTLTLTMDLGDLPEIAAGESRSVAGNVTASPSGLTITNPPTNTGYSISVRIAGGSAGTEYSVTFTATIGTATISRSGILKLV